MKPLLNTLFVTTQESYLAKDGECVAVYQDDDLKGKVPVHTLGGMVLFGQVSCSPFLLGHCAEKGVTVSWLTRNGRFLASMHGPVSGNVLLRREQYRRADAEDASAVIAASMVIGKIANCRTVLMRTARERPSTELRAAIERLAQCLARLRETLPLNMASRKKG